MKRARLVVAIVATVASVPALRSAARAQESGNVSLHVVRANGASECASGHEIARAVEQRLGHTVFGPPTADTRTVEVVVAKDGAGFRADVRSYDAEGALSGERSVQPSGSGCAPLTDALAVVLSVMIDPAAALAPEPTKPTTSDTASSAPLPALPPLSREKAPRRTHAFSAFARGGFGFAPSTTLSFGMAYEQALPVGGLRIDASASFPVEKKLDGREQGMRIGIASVGLFYCPLYKEVSVVRFSTCAGVDAGAWYVSTMGIDRSTNTSDPFVAGSARLGVAIALGPVAMLTLGAALDALILRPTYYLESGTKLDLYRARALAGSVDGGLGVRF